MNKLTTHRIIFWTAIALAAFGIVINLLDPKVFIPLIIVAAVFLLYKFPPRRFNRHPKVKPSRSTAEKMKRKSSSVRKTGSSSPKRKQYPFQVIDGQKGKHDQDDDLPKYH
ncbi:hypothetical protein [Paenibacillus sp. DMB20]|uniref:hypothetical protein n=1 Tax=Paenibacillus sp. DMB20 TaxID=1642570 RepID=UPI000627CF20|nr:hypothetical protein [Paenibacillus sp. DMB20]KKO52095.1 hypothetical protein XI25_21800 [Paenibacillus sp. DMB20]